MNVVGKAFPFHMISELTAKLAPFTVNRTDSPSPGTAFGESEVILGCAIEPSQPLKTNIALQVVQPDNSKIRPAIRAMRTEGRGSPGLTTPRRIPATTEQYSQFYCDSPLDVDDDLPMMSIRSLLCQAHFLSRRREISLHSINTN